MQRHQRELTQNWLQYYKASVESELISNVYLKLACEGYARGVTVVAWCLVWADELCQ